VRQLTIVGEFGRRTTGDHRNRLLLRPGLLSTNNAGVRRIVSRRSACLRHHLNGDQTQPAARADGDSWARAVAARRDRALTCGAMRVFLQFEPPSAGCRKCREVPGERFEFLANNPFYTRASRLISAVGSEGAPGPRLSAPLALYGTSPTASPRIDDGHDVLCPGTFRFSEKGSSAAGSRA
jgi:hypothetical protein